MGLVILTLVPSPRPHRPAGTPAFRRAAILMLRTVVLPGSVQRELGNRRIAKVAMHTAAVALAVVVLGAALALLAPQRLVSLATTPWVLALARIVLVAYAVGWVLLLVDAWRLANPLALPRRDRLLLTGLNGVLSLGLSGALLFASHVAAVQRDFVTTVFDGDTVTASEHGRYNVLLLGGDAGPGRFGIRPDSITVASIDEDTGRTVLVGLPRNLADVPFPDGSVMDREFPDGYDCDGCYLNGVYTWAADRPELFGDSVDSAEAGIEATTSAVEEITGLAINYHVLVDLRGFRDLVDAVGGVDVTVGERIPIGGVGAPITGWIEPGEQHLDGFETLWFARSRATSSDYSRMARQKCVLNAMLRQLDPQTVVLNLGSIAEAGKQVLSTSIPASELDRFAELTLKTKDLPVSTVSLVPPVVDTGAPDWDVVRTMIEDGLAASAVKDGLDLRPDRWLPREHRQVRDANSSTDLTRAC